MASGNKEIINLIKKKPYNKYYEEFKADEKAGEDYSKMTIMYLE